MPTNAQAYVDALGEMRSQMVASMRRNSAWEGFRRTLSELYPDQAHFIYELLQNAEDAQAASVEFQLFPDKLIFTHDGSRHFTEANIESITNIGHSTKRNEVNQIGKFGVGFKAVFGYSSTPRIFSGEFSFEIRDLFVPSWLKISESAAAKTVFEFPFNGGKSPQKCSAEISSWLREMSDNVLLFLRNIRRIRWSFGDGRWAELERNERADGVVEIYRISGHGETGARSFWLRFTEAIEPNSALFVAIAFQLGSEEETQLQFDALKPLAGQLKIVPTTGQLSIFFPAQKEDTHLRFHLHGPYASTVARDSIPPAHPENQSLLGATAKLLARSMMKVKELGLLTTEFLEVLPIPSDNLAAFYQPLLTTLISAFRNEALTPTENGGHAPALLLFKGPMAIRSAVDASSLAVLSDQRSARWVAGTMQNQRADKFLDALGIASWNWSELYAAMRSNFGGQGDSKAAEWLAAKDDEWVQKFYAVLKQMLEEEDLYESYPGGWLNEENRHRVQSWRIVRRSDGQHVTGTKVFFPDKGAAQPEFPLVKTALIEGKQLKQVEASKQFLVAAGVRAVEERHRIERVLRQHYTPGTQQPDWHTHLEHLRWFIRWWSENEHNSSLFGDAQLFFGNGALRLKPIDAYIDTPVEDTGMSALFAANIRVIKTRYPLRPEYATAGIAMLTKFAENCGAAVRLEFQKTSTQNNPHRRELYSGGGNRTAYETDNDFTIENLNVLLFAKNVGVSLLLWKTMCAAPPLVLQARYCPNQKSPYRYAPSQLICTLRDSAWIPDQTGRFLSPAEMRRENLANGFGFDDRNGWLTAIHFESKLKQDSVAVQEKRKIAISLGIPPEAVELLGQLPEAARKQALDIFLSELRRRKLNGEQAGADPAAYAELLTNSLDRPGKPAPESAYPHDSPVSNPKQRRERTDEEIENARANEPSANERSRLVASKVWESKNDEVRASLHEWYDGHCQICRMTFRKRSGENYFEARYLVLRTEEGGAWLDRPGNVLCLCATCCAKLQHGSIESPGNIVEQLRMLKLSREGGADPLAVSIRLCHEEVAITYNERHLLDLQQMLAAESKVAIG